MTIFKVDEDSGVPAQDQILAKVNQESNVEWGRRNDLSVEGRAKYYEGIGRNYLKSRITNEKNKAQA